MTTTTEPQAEPGIVRATAPRAPAVRPLSPRQAFQQRQRESVELATARATIKRLAKEAAFLARFVKIVAEGPNYLQAAWAARQALSQLSVEVQAAQIDMEISRALADNRRGRNGFPLVMGDGDAGGV